MLEPNRCCLASNIATLRRNIAILIGRLLEQFANGYRIFRRAFAHLLHDVPICKFFFVDKPIEVYKDLLQQVRKVVPVLRQIKDEEIKISYKDIQLDTFINIDPSEDCENLHLTETFRKYTRTGSDVNIYRRRVHLQVRESDSPFLLKKRTSRLPADTDRQNIEMPVVDIFGK